MEQNFEIGKLYKKIMNNVFLYNIIQDYTSSIIKNGIDKVKNDEFENSKELISQSICSNQNGYLIVKDIETISVGLYCYFVVETNFTENASFDEYAELNDRVSKILKANGYSFKYEGLLMNLLALMILKYSSYGHSLKDYVDSITSDASNTKKNKRLDNFINAFGIALPNIKYNEDDLFSQIIQLSVLTVASPDYNQHYLLQGLRVLTITNTRLALLLFDKFCKEATDQHKIIISLSAGLYEIKGEKFLSENAHPFILDNTIFEQILFGLSFVQEVNYDDAIKFLSLYNVGKDDYRLANALGKMLINILKSKKTYPEKTEIVEECFNFLETIIIKHGGTPSLQIIDQIAFLEGYDNQKTHLLTTVVSQPFFNVQEFLGVIEKVYWYLHDVESVVQVLAAIADKEPFQDLGKNFGNILNHCNKLELDVALINLIIDNRSSRRYLGNSLFNSNKFQNYYKFDYDILQLPPIAQYKLWVGLCQNIGEPESYLVSVLPLLNSNSWTVKESFTCKLEELSEDYAGHISKILETYMSLYDQPDVLDRVKNYIDDFFSINADCKNGIAELNPYNTQYKLIKEFNKLNNRNFSRTVEKGAKQNSFLSQMAKTVKLGKGGGWKLPGKEGVQKLGHFKSGMTLPRSLFIYPEKYDIMCGMEQRIDRNEEDFDIIQKLIANE